MFDVLPVTTDHATSCGPACIKMLLDYYKQDDVSLEDLIRECNVTTTGCTMGDVRRVGNAHGLNLIPYHCDAVSLMAQDRPAIIWWRYTHFVVFCGMNENDEPVICNPSMGRFPISKEAFKRFYSEVECCNGEPKDYAPRAERNYAKDEVFQFGKEMLIAIRPITHGERIAKGWNCNPYTIIDALNAQKKEE